MDKKAADSLSKLLPRLKIYSKGLKNTDWRVLKKRIENEYDSLFHYLYLLYGDHYDFFFYLEEVLKTAVSAHSRRSEDLKKLDKQRLENPHWYKSHKHVGAVGYADLLAGSIKGLEKRIPYLKDLDVTYFHLMPFFDCPEGENDGGYAVSDYRTVRDDLGSMTDLRRFSKKLRKENISFCADFVFNHTSDEHRWAKQAKEGDERYQNFYHMFDDRSIPDQYDETLREIFPDVRRGNFTWVEEAGKWVWTTFHNYQWDLNYKNPDLFNHILDEMLFMANAGVEIFRLDAIAFTGKELGTTSENRPDAHRLVRALNALTNIAAPAVVFKSEAIVHPDFVNSYISDDECELSYNPLLMALLWEALATRETKLLHHSMQKRFEIHEGTAWVNYVRSHDDIGWTFSDEDAAELGINGYDHRNFLNQFYTGQFPGSFAKGKPFQFNPDTGDMRVCGTSASLSGLEKGIENGNEDEIDLSIKRMSLLYAINMFIGGIPLIYLGDELALLNDKSYKENPSRKGDSRWVHRVALDKKSMKARKNKGTVENRIFTNLQKMIAIRSKDPIFMAPATNFISTGNPHLFSFTRVHEDRTLLFIGNFSEHSLQLDSDFIRTIFGSGHTLKELWSDQDMQIIHQLDVEPYQFFVLVKAAD